MADFLKQHAAQVWARFDHGLKANKVLRRALQYIRHKDALRGVVRVEADNLGLGGDRATQRKKFMRLVTSYRVERGWVVYTDKTRSVIGKATLKEKVPILNPLTESRLRNRYGKEHRRWPDKSYFMHPWQYVAAVMALKSHSAETIVQTAISAASLLLTLMQLEKPTKSLGKAQRVSAPVLSILAYMYGCVFFCYIACWLQPQRPWMRGRPARSDPGRHLSKRSNYECGDLGPLFAIQGPGLLHRNLPVQGTRRKGAGRNLRGHQRC